MAAIESARPIISHNGNSDLKRPRLYRTGQEPEHQPVIIVNETLARKYWPNVMRLASASASMVRWTKAPWMQMVGVVQDVKHELNLPVTPDYYLPHAQDPGTQWSWWRGRR